MATITEMSVAELMDTFHDGLLALIPIFERAKLGWKDDDMYDPWENTAAALFDAIIGSCIDSGKYDPSIFNLPRYGLMQESYANFSYFTEAGTNGLTAFVELETDIKPFDTVFFQKLNSKAEVIGHHRKKKADVTFAFVPRCENGTLQPEIFSLVFEE